MRGVWFAGAALAAGAAAAGGTKIPVTLAEPAKVSVVIDDGAGRRVRNVASAVPCAAGETVFEWDGRREDGADASAGEYRARIVTHPGITYRMLGHFMNGGENHLFNPYGPNHVTYRSFVAKEGRISPSSAFTEGGRSTVVLDNSGKMLHGWGETWLNGNVELFHVSRPDGRCFFSIREKHGKWFTSDRGLETASGSGLQIFGYCWDDASRPRMEIAAKPPRWASKEDTVANAFHVVPRSDEGEKGVLAGAAWAEGRLFVSLRRRGVAVFDLAESANGQTGTVSEVRRTIPLDDPGALCVSWAGEVYVQDGLALKRIDAKTLGVAKVCDLPERMVRLALPPKGTDDGLVFAIRGKPNDTQVFAYSLADGAERKAIGEPGGPYLGPWRRDRMWPLRGIGFDSDGGLWTLEDRVTPKRLAKWDVATGKIACEKYGPEFYGAPGAGMDPGDASRWIGMGAEWKVDLAAGREEVTSVASDFRARTWRWARRGGKTYLIGNSRLTRIFAYEKGVARPIAAVGTASAFYGEGSGKGHELLVWRDRNGDGKAQDDEIQTSPEGTKAATGYWGPFLSDLDFTVSVAEGAAVRTVNLGFPDYDLAKAWSAGGVEKDLPRGTKPPAQCTSFSDTKGRAIAVTVDPMLAFGRDGRLAWYMKNPFPEVHGSHKAPGPVHGETQGVLFGIGAIPYSDAADIFALMGNYGRVFFLTTDGVFLDDVFTDCRTTRTVDENFIGSEPFGGSFQWDEKGGCAILQAGGGGYRVYRLEGFDRIRETTLALTVTAADLAAARESHPLEEPRSYAPAASGVIHNRRDQKDAQLIAEWEFGASRVNVRGYWTDDVLALAYSVQDSSPWTNRGDDPCLMFKTGDCVDLQLRGEDGDVRLLVAPPQPGSERPTVALYRHRLPKGAKRLGEPHEFDSPSRKYVVEDAVVDPPGVEVEKPQVSSDGYRVTVRIPLGLLGLRHDRLPLRTVPADFGVIYGDADGTVNTMRLYWSNKDTGLVSDVPGEMIPTPDKWGKLRFSAKRRTGSATDVDLPGFKSVALRDCGFAGWEGLRPGITDLLVTLGGSVFACHPERNCAWNFDDPDGAPVRRGYRKEKETVGVVNLDNGITSWIALGGKGFNVRHGHPVRGLENSHSGKEIPDIFPVPKIRMGGKKAGAVAYQNKDRNYEFVRFNSTGEGLVTLLTENGGSPAPHTVVATRLPIGGGETDELVLDDIGEFSLSSVTALPGGSLLAAVNRHLVEFRRGTTLGDFVRAGDWPSKITADAISADGGLVAAVDTAAGTLRLYDVKTRRQVAERKGLRKPTLVSFCGEFIVVWESGANRLHRFKVEG